MIKTIFINITQNFFIRTNHNRAIRLWYGNPSSNKNWFGKSANNVVEDSLYIIMDCFGASSINDFIITSGATEANNG